VSDEDDDASSDGGDSTDSEEARKLPEVDVSGLDEEAQMAALLGFGSFETTKHKAVEDNQNTANVGGVKKNPVRHYRQYMNRRGGFNRPLDKVP